MLRARGAAHTLGAPLNPSAPQSSAPPIVNSVLAMHPTASHVLYRRLLPAKHGNLYFYQKLLLDTFIDAAQNPTGSLRQE
eukprot:3764004-Prymnesium_polylepis.1